MIGGCPSVPVTSGGYYDYKYADFDRYTGGQNVPLIVLQDLAAAGAANRIADYFAAYEPARTAATRRQAADQIEAWYRRVRSSVNGSTEKD